MDFQCFHCPYSSEYKNNLRRHITRNHINPKNDDRPSVSCMMCQYKSSSRPDMKGHYVNIHDLNCSVQLLEFDTMETFEKWKASLEADDRSRYVRLRPPRRTKNAIHQTYICHRDGHFSTKGKGKRRLKRLGSNKINGCCPSQMNVTVNLPSGTVAIKYMPTHVGHTQDLGRVLLSDSDRNMIAQKLSAGIRYDRIIGSIRDSLSKDGEGRVHLVTRKDVANIARDFKINAPVVRHSSDVVSVDAWVREKQESSNTVRFYKPQGQKLPERPTLANDDFILVLASDYQIQMLAEHGKNIICFDGTHGTNAYNFELTTLLTVDESHKGFPCAFMFSSRSDTGTMSLFAEVVKDALGHELHAATLMSDMAEIYLNGWCSVMPPPTRQLYCSWHVLRAWRKNLSKIKDTDKRASVFKQLKVLQEESDEKAFIIFLRVLIAELLENPATNDFGRYFSSEYGNNATFWAYCYRQHCGINTNMFLESLHKTLKHVYLGGKKTKRLDKAIHALMDLTRDKVFERWITIHKGADSTKLQSIQKRHDHAVAMSHDCIVLRSPTGWSVRSEKSHEYYDIVVSNESCTCSLKCEDCDCCIHRFKCSCKDGAIKWNMCKHIHLMMLENQKSQVADPDILIPAFDRNPSDVDEHPALQICENDSSKIDREAMLLDEISVKPAGNACFEKRMREAEDLWHRIKSECMQTSDIDIAINHLKPILPTILAAKDSPVQFAGASHTEKKQVNPNKNITPQKRFESTKIKRKIQRKPLFTKPSTSEELSISARWFMRSQQMEEENRKKFA